MMMRSFTATNMTEAMEMARDELGEDAVILSSNNQKGGGVTVTFGLDRDDGEQLFANDEIYAEPVYRGEDAASLPSTDDDPVMEAIATLLEHHSVPHEVRSHVLHTAAKIDLPRAASLSNVQSALTDIFNVAFRFDPLPLSGENTRVILVGAPGCGKTITAAKLAAKMVVDNQPVRVISTDTRRAGGVDQLQGFTNILGVSLDTADSRSELREQLQSCSAEERVIIDSAGCNPYDFQELKELGEFARLQGVEPVLVCAAGTDPHEATEIAGVFSFLDIDRVIITRTDCARHYGGLLSVAKSGGFAFSHVTSSARAMGDCQPMNAETLTQLFTQYQRERLAA